MAKKRALEIPDESMSRKQLNQANNIMAKKRALESPGEPLSRKQQNQGNMARKRALEPRRM